MKDNKSILSRWNKKCAHTKQSLSHRELGVESREVFSSFFSPLLQTHYNSVFCCVIEEKTSFCEQYIAYAHVSNMSNWSFCEFKHVEWLSCWLAYRIDVCVCVWVFVSVWERERATGEVLYIVSMSWGNILFVFLTIYAIEGSKSMRNCIRLNMQAIAFTFFVRN